MNRNIRIVVVATALMLSSLASVAQNLSPMQFGFDTCRDGLSRYWAIYNTHVAAKEAGVDVDYSALANTTIELTLPSPAPLFIPLTRHNDFYNVLFYVLDTVSDRYLFRIGDDNYTEINVDPALVDAGDFRSVPELATGEHLLSMNDANPWVAERLGFGEPAWRMDVLYIVDGKAQNTVVSSYQTEATKMRCYEIPVDSEAKEIKNLHLRRHHLSTHKLCLFSCYFQNNVNISNISVFTPQSKPFKHVNNTADLVARCQSTQEPKLQNLSSKTKYKLLSDAAIYIQTSTNIHCKDIYVDGTYSIPGRNGYAISCNNTWNATFRHVVADGNWGVWGNNNMSNTTLEDCDVNRFDIHCYGKDVTARRCTFRKKQIQFSSLFGTLQFDSCQFLDCIPVSIRGSYNAFTPFDIVVNNCYLQATRTHHQLVDFGIRETKRNSRPELHDRLLPSIEIVSLTVDLPDNVRYFDIIQPSGKTKMSKDAFDNDRKIEIKGLYFMKSKKDVNVRLTSVPLKSDTKKEVIPIRSWQLDAEGKYYESTTNFIDYKHTN
ncbi:MAG: hypothetical protein MJZ81_03315 [Bacteroidales bacterium]|nr:hypothetical protein [Bacteroidales bacterium]